MNDRPKQQPVTESGEKIPDPPPEIAETVEVSDADEQESLDNARRRYLLGRFWLSAKGFWGRNGAKFVWALSIGLFVLIVLNVTVQYGINVWNRHIFDALEKKDSAVVFHLIAIFIPLGLGSVLVNVCMTYVRMNLQRRWRAWLNHAVVDRWLAAGRYYQLNLVSGDHKNPEFRIADDLRVATDAPTDFAAGVTSAMLSATTFIIVLWTIGGALTLPIGGSEVTIPGFLVIAAIIYSAVASTSMAWIARNFVVISEGKNQAEAEYRYALTRIRENGESIALLGGEEEERAGIDRAFGKVILQWVRICGQYMRTTAVSHGSSVIAPVIPILLAAPKYLDGSMSLGQVMQAASAFTIVQSAFGWLVDNYPRLAEWTAGARRIAALMVSLDALEKAEAGEGTGRIDRGETKYALKLNDLSVTLDDGTAVVSDAEVAIEPGERVLVAGESGTGKSTLVRAIAGLWPWGEGSVEFHGNSRVFMLPQKPYVPSGTLRRTITYPAPAEDWDEQQIGDALDKVGLAHLKEKIEEEGPWEQTLSGGEKQRLAFARVLLHKPDILVLDESTSALDPPGQDAIMELLNKELKNVTIISVAHRPELEAFHSRKIVLERRKGGARLVSDIDLIKRPGRKRLLHRWLRRGRKAQRKAEERKSA
jgi:vitamin B12/bleomycin/antimicrobial peptide transport system ATP-binding/permease protein